MQGASNKPETTPQEDLWRIASQSYFPILVLFHDTGKQAAFDAPGDIPAGRPFMVLECQDVE